MVNSVASDQRKVWLSHVSTIFNVSYNLLLSGFNSFDSQGCTSPWLCICCTPPTPPYNILNPPLKYVLWEKKKLEKNSNEERPTKDRNIWNTLTKPANNFTHHFVEKCQITMVFNNNTIITKKSCIIKPTIIATLFFCNTFYRNRKRRIFWVKLCSFFPSWSFEFRSFRHFVFDVNTRWPQKA